MNDPLDLRASSGPVNDPLISVLKVVIQLQLDNQKAKYLEHILLAPHRNTWVEVKHDVHCFSREARGGLRKVTQWLLSYAGLSALLHNSAAFSESFLSA